MGSSIFDSPVLLVLAAVHAPTVVLLWRLLVLVAVVVVVVVDALRHLLQFLVQVVVVVGEAVLEGRNERGRPVSRGN